MFNSMHSCAACARGQRLTRALALLSAVTSVALIAGAALREGPTSDVIRAHRFEVVNDDGSVSAALATQDGAGHMTIFAHERPVVTLGAQPTSAGWVGTVSTVGPNNASVVVGVLDENSPPVTVSNQTDATVPGSKVTDTRKKMIAIQARIDEFRKHGGRLPADLDNLLQPSEENMNKPWVDNEDDLKDAWGNRFHYRLRPGNTYELVSLGADGAEGGQGPDADITLSPE